MYVLTYNLALGQETVATRFNRPRSRGARNVRDSVALGSYVDSRSQAFSDSRAWRRKSTQKPREERVRYLLVAGHKRLGPCRLPD